MILIVNMVGLGIVSKRDDKNGCKLPTTVLGHH